MENKGISHQQVLRNAQALLAIRCTDDLAKLLGLSAYQLEIITFQHYYHSFKIPKKSGNGFRTIEDPQDSLKVILQDLNSLLQSVYHLNRTEAAFGFLIHVLDEKTPRNIRTNAEQHVGKPWMLNTDFQDFFHAVSTEMLEIMWTNPPFCFEDKTLVHWLTQLTTHHDRLPMGSPTSPVLSNFASMPLDNDLLAISKTQHWTYTRFADDLTFSSHLPIVPDDVKEIRGISKIHGFTFNESKVHIFSPDHEKTVTGLRLCGNEVALPLDFMKEAHEAVKKYQILREAQYWSGDYQSKMVREMNDEIAGYLRFANFIIGKNDPAYRDLQLALDNANAPVNPHGSASWLNFSNYC